MQPPLLGNCQYDKMYVTANGDYPLLCGQNSGKAYIFMLNKADYSAKKKGLTVSCFSITYLHSGHHIYLDVAGKSFTDITFQADLLRPQLYTCPDRFGIAAQTSDVPYAVVS